MDENEFCKSIEHNFPYNDRGTAVAIIDQANSISANAMFIVLHELCRPGPDAEVTKDTLLNLIDTWSDRMDHPLAQSVVQAARVMAKGSVWPVDKSLALMEQISPFEGQYGALCIAYFSCDDVDELLEVPEGKIRAEWDAKSRT